jgi:hypothetical protein
MVEVTLSPEAYRALLSLVMGSVAQPVRRIPEGGVIA